MAKQKIRAAYQIRDLGIQEVRQMVYDYVDNRLVSNEVTIQEHCFMAYFPQGHSIRLVGIDALRNTKHNHEGLHMKPRMIDMNTGDVVDVGGDPYDFANDSDDQFELGIMSARTEAATA
jgi:hypothetical protein